MASFGFVQEILKTVCRLEDNFRHEYGTKICMSEQCVYFEILRSQRGPCNFTIAFSQHVRDTGITT